MKVLNTTVYTKLAPSKIDGVGVFAIRDIRSGTRLFDISDCCTEDILPEVMSVVENNLGYIHGKAALTHPNTWCQHIKYMNHSYTPNSDGECSLRDIKKGEEITLDYTALITKNDNKHFYFL